MKILSKLHSISIMLICLDYSRVEVAADARHQPMKFITNDHRECGDLIMLPRRHEIATSLCSSQRMGRNEADVVRSVRPPRGKKC